MRRSICPSCPLLVQYKYIPATDTSDARRAIVDVDRSHSSCCYVYFSRILGLRCWTFSLMQSLFLFCIYLYVYIIYYLLFVALLPDTTGETTNDSAQRNTFTDERRVCCLSVYIRRERERESFEMRKRSDVDGGTTQCRWSAGKAESAEMAESIGIWRGGEENNRGEDVKEPLKTKQTASTAPTDPQFNCSSLPCLIWKRFVR